MPLPPLLDRADAVVFDAYGTLLDVHSAVQRHAGAVGPEAQALSETWRQKQLEYSWVLALCGRYAPFWTLTERALDHALARHPRVDRAVRADLIAAYRALDAYPEVPATLEHLRRAGLKTAILSNGDPAMLDAAVTAADLGGRLDAVLSVEPAGTFKTAPAAYDLAPKALGVSRERIVFLSSNRWDIAGAAAYGFAPVWVNRTDQPDEYPDLAPVRVIRSLDGLLA
ncbi:haloacid dehalogenase type II [Methylobacterium platani]|uniref:(S)-2-haloacid dehalogenase n=2 Tax=Methylobacterium platani TaxID=427683 RepID=A0A179S9J0_9HYPH|nr:haloacid dehalogenase type II [Methylobacterium platani]KMO15161.1 haloacid dehalogenase [Methylobacterium platani JCM 14648]OAS23287.1 haloacid dehalogenase [Methylobacterium platani]